MPPSPPSTVPITFTTPIQPFNTSTDQQQTTSTSTANARIKTRGNQAFPNITTIYLGNLSFSINPQIISNSFKKFGCIKGMSWRKQRSFAFIKFSSCEQALEAILRMHGKLLYGKRVAVYLAKTQLRSYSEEYQSEDVSMVKPSKCFSLQPNSKTTMALSVSALIIDKDYMSQEKLSSWLGRREISAEKISQWGPHGTIVQCRDVEEYNRLLQCPSIDTNGFLKIQSMTERENYYSRFIWLEIKGIPLEYESRNNISKIAEAWGKVLFFDQKPSGSVFCFIETCYLRSILDFGTIIISNNTSLPICVSEVPYNPKNSVSSSNVTDIQPQIQEQMTPCSQRHSSGRLQEIQNLNSNCISNVNGNICGDFPTEMSSLVHTSDTLGGEFLETDRSTSQAGLYSQVFERVKDALSNETQGAKYKASLVDQEKACDSSASVLPEGLCTSLLQSSQTFHASISPSIPSTSFNQNMSLAGDFSLFTKANPQSTSCTLKAKPNKAPVDCHAICSKALRFAKIVQDKKYISKNKDRDAERMPSMIKKKCKEKARKNNIVQVGDDEHSCSISQDDPDDDESASMFSLGDSLGITLDGMPARSKNDTFSDFLLEVNKNVIPTPPL